MQCRVTFEQFSRPRANPADLVRTPVPRAGVTSGAGVPAGRFGAGAPAIAGAESGTVDAARLASRAPSRSDARLGGAGNAGRRPRHRSRRRRGRWWRQARRRGDRRSGGGELGGVTLAERRELTRPVLLGSWVDVAQIAPALAAEDPVPLVHADRLEMSDALVHRQATGQVPRTVGQPLTLDGARDARSEKEKRARSATPHAPLFIPRSPE
jgi:hypothetical protein